MLKWIMSREHRSNRGTVEFREVNANTLVTITLNPFNIEYKELKEKSINTTYTPLHNHMGGYIAEDMYPSSPAVNDVALEALEQYLIEQGERKTETFKSELSSREIMNEYSFGSNILFKIGTIDKWLDKPLKWLIDGQAYLPGKTVVRAKFYSEEKFDVNKFKIWKSAGVIQAKVKTIVTAKNGEVLLHVDDCTLPECVITFNKSVYPKMEWALLKASEKCQKCKGPLTTTDPTLTSVNPMNNKLGRYRIHCSKCVVDAIPKEKRDAFLASRNTPVQDCQSEC